MNLGNLERNLRVYENQTTLELYLFTYHYTVGAHWNYYGCNVRKLLMSLIKKLFGKMKRMAYENYPNEYEQTIWVRDKDFHRLEFRTTRPSQFGWTRNIIKLRYKARLKVKE